MVYLFEDLPENQAAGGKAETLARLYRKGYPVPPGVVILPQAFRGDTLKEQAITTIRRLLPVLTKNSGNRALAVRSSALCEDSSTASFAGELESVLNVRSIQDILASAGKVRQSGRSERVDAYSREKNISGSREVAVILQVMIPAELAGVLFTVDPIKGDYTLMTGNYVHGQGESLVSGEKDAFIFHFERGKGIYTGPRELKKTARQLFRLGEKLEKELAFPQDMEWAIHRGKLWLLQSRPISTLTGRDAVTGEINHSQRGHFTWTNANFQEAIPDVMTPGTFSLVWLYYTSTSMITFPRYYAGAGNIGGRPYMNLSLMLSLLAALKMDYKSQLHAGFFGDFPDGLEVPIIPLKRGFIYKQMLPYIFKRRKQIINIMKKIPHFLQTFPDWCHSMNGEIEKISSQQELRTLWQNKLLPQYVELGLMVRGATVLFGKEETKIKKELRGLVGEEDSQILLSGFSTTKNILPSLGPLVGLAGIVKGNLSREEYNRCYGHRGPHEFEISIPTPGEDPALLEKRIAEYIKNGEDVSTLLQGQRERYEKAWDRLLAVKQLKSAEFRKKISRVAEGAHRREAVRSEWVRMIRLLRRFWLKAGDLQGLGEEIFFLYLEEILQDKGRGGAMTQTIAARKKSYARYRELPPYPAIIIGAFDPFQWAASPNKRSDYYQAGETTGTVSGQNVLKGMPGSAGEYRGRVRILREPEEGNQLQQGEILVTTTTNVGWTLLFPRCGAVVTDVGAPLSHAAIIARELGIPAVVGCGRATMALKNGDIIRVDGIHGIVEKLPSPGGMA